MREICTDKKKSRQNSSTLTERSVVGANVVAGGELSSEGGFPNTGRAQHADLVSGHSFVARVLFSLHSRELRRRAETREQTLTRDSVSTDRTARNRTEQRVSEVSFSLRFSTLRSPIGENKNLHVRRDLVSPPRSRAGICFSSRSFRTLRLAM